MPEFMVDDDLAELVWELAKPKPFEQLTFSAALRRVLLEANAAAPKAPSPNGARQPKLQQASLVVPGIHQWQKKAASPDSAAWAYSVPELKGHKNLHTWQAICDVLRIEVAGDSARRKLRNWVKANRPQWPEVPSIQGDA